ncbi:MAG: C45 family peptidase, partial [Bacteroidetes bacterium]|nr:C45 family peptidase [Bacteroidota bacterium]
CSSVAYAKNGKLFLAHNEDLFTCFINSMYVVKISISGKPQFIGLNYPGILSGMPPCMNEAGILQVGNDISGLHIEPSVPMVFHYRSAMDATSLSDAISRVTIPERARTMTHTLGSFQENRIVCVEAAPSKHEQHEVDNFFVHTNHFILPEMTDIPLDEDTLPSSISRFDVLTDETKPFVGNQEGVTNGLFTEFLSSHDGEYSPCVHDHGGGSTLGHAVFDFQDKNLRMNYSNPCLGISKKYNI